MVDWYSSSAFLMFFRTSVFIQPSSHGKYNTWEKWDICIVISRRQVVPDEKRGAEEKKIRNCPEGSDN
jgi:hypothetical protein